MRSLLATDLGRLRLISWVEGVSYLLLVGLAVPLKHLAGWPEPVQLMGRVHGLLFVLFVLALTQAAISTPFSARRVALALGASMVPLGALLFERSLRTLPPAKLG